MRAVAFALIVATAALAQPTERLNKARTDAAAALERAAILEQAAKSSRDAAERARIAAPAIAARIQAAEAQASVAEARLAQAQGRRRVQERRLAAREQPVAELVAGLHRLASRPPAVALLQPGSIRDAVHLRAVLATLTPEIARRTRALRAEVAHSRALEADAGAALADMRRAQRDRAEEQRRLAQLDIAERRRSADLAGIARAETDRAAALAREATTLAGLAARIDADNARRARLASLPGPLPRPARLGDTLPVEAARTTPALGRYRVPALGPIVRGYGERGSSGARATGVTIGTRPGALVVAPAAGRVAFAGLYRGYGAIAIVDHGGGFASLLTGLSANLARVGDQVAQGGPIGRAGPGGVPLELRHDGRAGDLAPVGG